MPEVVHLHDVASEFDLAIAVLSCEIHSPVSMTAQQIWKLLFITRAWAIINTLDSSSESESASGWKRRSFRVQTGAISSEKPGVNSESILLDKLGHRYQGRARITGLFGVSITVIFQKTIFLVDSYSWETRNENYRCSKTRYSRKYMYPMEMMYLGN